MGLWYEIERTHLTSQVQWQSGLLVFSNDIFNERFSYAYAGTVSDVCRGPVHAWADTSQLQRGELDVLMNLGQEQQYGNPWNVQCKSACTATRGTCSVSQRVRKPVERAV